MPPRSKYSRAEIELAALELARSKGIEAVTARSLGEALGTSAKPIFGQFDGMEEVRLAVVRRAEALYHQMTQELVESHQYPVYKSTGMAYIRFAREEPALFRLLFMCDRSEQPHHEASAPDMEQLIRVIQGATGFSAEQAYRFHLEVWIYVHGVATMLATAYLNWDDDFISRSLTDVFEGLKLRFAQEAIG